MDPKTYYQKLRQIEATLPEAFVVVVSEETPDGGKAGVRSEVSRGVAAKLLLEKRATLASEEEAAAFREAVAEAKRVADQAVMASRMQITVMSEADMRALKSGMRPKS